MPETLPDDQEIRVVDNPDDGRFETHVDGHMGFVSYLKRGDTIVFMHTEVAPELQGRGVANALARAALERARSEHWSVVPRCPFIAKYIARHPEFQPLVRRDA